MKIFGLQICLFILPLLLCLVIPPKAWAYLDPGTGSYIFQVTVAIFLGGLFAVKIFWVKIRGFFKNLFSKKKRHPADER